MSKHWLSTLALMMVTAVITSGATAAWLTKKHQAEALVWQIQADQRVAEAVAMAPTETAPELIPVWFMKKAINFIKGNGCGSNGEYCPLDGDGGVTAATSIPKDATLARLPIKTNGTSAIKISERLVSGQK